MNNLKHYIHYIMFILILNIAGQELSSLKYIIEISAVLLIILSLLMIPLIIYRNKYDVHSVFVRMQKIHLGTILFTTVYILAKLDKLDNVFLYFILFVLYWLISESINCAQDVYKIFTNKKYKLDK